MLFCIRLTNFIQMRPLTVEIWRHISIHGCDITTSVFENGRHIEILLWLWPHHRNLHVIVHQTTEFRPNRSTYCENNDVMSIFQADGRGRWILLPVSNLLMSLLKLFGEMFVAHAHIPYIQPVENVTLRIEPITRVVKKREIMATRRCNSWNIW